MRIGITNLQNKVKLDRKKIIKKTRSILKSLGEEKAELSLLFVDDCYIKRLNRRYRKKNYKTDVLAFAMRDKDASLGIKPPVAAKNILGDVVISAETARREAYKRKTPVQKELSLYLIHGILHLLGYDDQKISDRKKMKIKEEEMMEAM